MHPRCRRFTHRRTCPLVYSEESGRGHPRDVSAVGLIQKLPLADRRDVPQADASRCSNP
jgi:hypothetical protein